MAKVHTKRPSFAREISRNLTRRKLRTALTLSGIALGSFALMVTGSIAENFNGNIGSLKEFLGEQVLVRGEGSTVFFPIGHLPVSYDAKLAAVEGVRVVVPRVTVQVSDESSSGFGPPELLFGVDIERADKSPLNDFKLSAGRSLVPGDRGKVVLGAELARKLSKTDSILRPGETIVIRGKSFEVVGVGAITSTPVDDFATTNIADTKDILRTLEPFLEVDSVVDEYSVYPVEGLDPKVLATRLEQALASEKVEVFSPENTEDQLRSITAIFNSIILGSALVAILVGGVAIINTMIFSVTERTREIGIRKAVGASERDIKREFLVEAAVTSFLGGALGGGLGHLFVILINKATADSGAIAFSVTPRLWLFVFLLAVVVGVGAGLIPARRAARIDPVRALKTVG